MSMETIERLIHELEAIKNYSKVVKEKDNLSRKAAALEVSLRSSSEELAQYKEFKVHLADGGEVSLDGARRDFLGAMDGEIERRARERLEVLKLEYEAKMPQLIYERLVQVLKGRLWPTEIAVVIRAEAERRADSILYHRENWPDNFTEYYKKEVDSGVKSGVDSEFQKRVEARVQQRLSELVNTVWSRWFSDNIEPRVAELERKANENAFQFLKGPWPFTCDQCGATSSDELTSFGVVELLRKGWVQIECTNPACEDRSLFSSRRHRFRVSLYDLVEVYTRHEY